MEFSVKFNKKIRFREHNYILIINSCPHIFFVMFGKLNFIFKSQKSLFRTLLSFFLYLNLRINLAFLLNISWIILKNIYPSIIREWILDIIDRIEVLFWLPFKIAWSWYVKNWLTSLLNLKTFIGAGSQNIPSKFSRLSWSFCSFLRNFQDWFVSWSF